MDRIDRQDWQTEGQLHSPHNKLITISILPTVNPVFSIYNTGVWIGFCPINSL